MYGTAAANKTSIRDVFFILFSKQNVLIGTWFLVVVATALVAFGADPIYRTSAKVLIKPYVDPLLHYDSPPGILRPNPVSTQDINSEIDIINSDEVLRKVVEEMGLINENGSQAFISKLIDTGLKKLTAYMVTLGLSVETNPLDQAVESLRSRMKIVPVTMSNMIEITMTGKDPKKLTDTVNIIVDHFIDRHIEVHQAEAGMEFFNTQVELYQGKLKEAEAALKAFHENNSITDIAAQRTGNLKVLEALQTTLGDIKGQIAEYEIRLAGSKKNVTALTSELRDNLVLIEYFKSLLPLMVELERIAQLYPKNSVEYLDTASQVEEIKKRIDVQQRSIIAGSEIDFSALVSHQKALEEEIKQIQDETVALTAKEVEYNRLSREFGLAEKNYLLYMSKTEEARIQNQKDSSRVANVSVASWAFEPSVPIFPRKFLMLVISLFVGFILGAAGAFVSYYMDHTVKTPGEMLTYGEIPALSAIEIIETK